MCLLSQVVLLTANKLKYCLLFTDIIILQMLETMCQPTTALCYVYSTWQYFTVHTHSSTENPCSEY